MLTATLLPLAESDAPPVPPGAGMIAMPGRVRHWAAVVPLTLATESWSIEDRPEVLDEDRREIEAWYEREWEKRYGAAETPESMPLSKVLEAWRRADERWRERLPGVERAMRVMKWVDLYEREAND